MSLMCAKKKIQHGPFKESGVECFDETRPLYRFVDEHMASTYGLGAGYYC